MSRRAEHPRLVAGSVIVALLLSIVPWPAGLNAAAPYWAALVFIYWGLETTSLRYLGQAFAVGLVLDVLTGTLLGQHALSLVILSYLVSRFRHRIRFFPPWQQAAAVFALLLNDRIVQLWIIALEGSGLPGWSYWLPPITGVALWPWLFLLLDAMRRHRRVST